MNGQTAKILYWPHLLDCRQHLLYMILRPNHRQPVFHHGRGVVDSLDVVLPTIKKP